MGTFTSRLVVEIMNDDDFPYRVWKMFEFHSGHAGSGLLLRVEADFRFNGTSIPPGLRWLISPSDPELLQCAAAHDKGFATGTLIMRVDGVEKEVAVHRGTINALMAEMMIAWKVKLWKRVMINSGLSVGSVFTWRKCRRANGRAAVRTVTTA